MAVISSLIVEVKMGSCEAVLKSLARIPAVSVFGVKENQIVTVVEGDDLKVVEETIKELYFIEKVTGVYPVFSGDYE